MITHQGMTGPLVLPPKDFFSMSEASRLTQVPPHRLRYWEDQVRLLRPSRQPSGHRRYARTDLEMILDIKEMVERRKMTLAGARRALLDRRRGQSRGGERAEGTKVSDPATSKLLREIREEIHSLVQELG